MVHLLVAEDYCRCATFRWWRRRTLFHYHDDQPTQQGPLDTLHLFRLGRSRGKVTHESVWPFLYLNRADVMVAGLTLRLLRDHVDADRDTGSRRLDDRAIFYRLETILDFN